MKDSHPKYRPDIDGLRAIAVLAVLVFHAFPKALPGGFVGVDIFFVISGFLISTILFKSIDHGTFSILDFYSRRIRRIFPALILVLFFTLLFGHLCLYIDELNQFGKHVAGSIGFIQNFILWNEDGYFDNASETKPLLHIWSLGIEEQFYFIWPLLLYFSSMICKNKKYNRYAFLIANILIFTISFLLNIDLVTVDPSKTFYLPQYRFWELAAGGMIAWIALYKPISTIKLSKQSEKKSQSFKKLTLNILTLVGIGILFFTFSKFNHDTVFPGKNALLPVLATAIIILVGQGSALNRKVLSNKILVWIGLISYPLYLWHWPILSYGRIIYGEEPPKGFRVLAILFSFLLSWLTVKFIEKPFRFVEGNKNKKVLLLLVLALVIGALGLIIGFNTSSSNVKEELKIPRRNNLTIGKSDRWYQGKDDWLFLGNSHDKTLSKLTLSKEPTQSEIETTRDIFANLAKDAAQYNTRVALIIGPNKSSIYPEYLPNELTPSPKRYIDFFLKGLENISNLTVYDPTSDLLASKQAEGILYWMTDTHWNNRGAFIAFVGLSKLLDFPHPKVKFKHGTPYSGDLIEISGLNDFPLHAEDNWETVWPNHPALTTNIIPNKKKTSFGETVIVSNANPLSDNSIWIVGDSFTKTLKQYFDATFKEVRYVGHWDNELKTLSSELNEATSKPDIIIFIRVERSF